MIKGNNFKNYKLKQGAMHQNKLNRIMKMLRNQRKKFIQLKMLHQQMVKPVFY